MIAAPGAFARPQQGPGPAVAGPVNAALTDKSNPYNFNYTPSTAEQQAGVNPQHFYSMLNSDGSIKSPYSVNPQSSEAFQQMQNFAESPGLSPWASLQQQQNSLQSQQQKDALGARTQGQTQQAMQQLQSTGGGTGSGAAMLMAQQGERANIMGAQNIGSQELQNNLGIQQQDALNKQNMLGQVANTETGAQAANAQSAMQDTQNANMFSANRYNQLMSTWGAQQTANAQRQAANGGKK